MMHLPDAWGFLVFGNPKGEDTPTDPVPQDPSWPARLAAMHVYYAQAAFHDEHKCYASNLDYLKELIDVDITDPFDILIDLDDKGGYVATISGSPDGTLATVTNDRLLRIGVGDKSKSTTF